MTIKLYEDKYRDDLIFMVLQAKDAIGRTPTINNDLLDIKANYFDRSDCFWVAVDARDRVVGCIGFSKTDDPNEAFLHRLFVKASQKRHGIGTKLLETAESHLPNAQREWFYETTFRLMRQNLARVKGDLDWFIEKFDYRNASADWRNSRDAVSRTMQKLQGIYPADPPYKNQ